MKPTAKNVVVHSCSVSEACASVSVVGNKMGTIESRRRWSDEQTLRRTVNLQPLLRVASGEGWRLLISCVGRGRDGEKSVITIALSFSGTRNGGAHVNKGRRPFPNAQHEQ